MIIQKIILWRFSMLKNNTINISSNPQQYHPIVFDITEQNTEEKARETRTITHPEFDITEQNTEEKTRMVIVNDFIDKDYTKGDHYDSFSIRYISSLLKNWNNVDFFEKKFDELKEKEMNNTLTKFEEKFLYEVIEKKLLDFPNPFLPKDHEELMKTKSEYKTIVNKFRNRKSS